MIHFGLVVEMRIDFFLPLCNQVITQHDYNFLILCVRLVSAAMSVSFPFRVFVVTDIVREPQQRELAVFVNGARSTAGFGTRRRGTQSEK